MSLLNPNPVVYQVAKRQRVEDDDVSLSLCVVLPAEVLYDGSIFCRLTTQQQ